MSDYIFVDSGSTANPYHTTEHYYRRVLIGDVQQVRGRLIAALERLGYDILDDEETVVRGRRGAVGWATSYASADVLDYPRVLVVRLKSANEHATRVTFDYMIKHPSLSVGEKEVLTREAEAISAIAEVRPNAQLCMACGQENMDDSRFCRSCGSRLAGEVLELEILRMSAETRAGHTSVVTSTMLSLSMAVIVTASIVGMLISGTLLSSNLWILLGSVLGLLVINALVGGFAWHRVNRALKRETPHDVPVFVDKANVVEIRESARSVASLPPPSVTEGTTELISDNEGILKEHAYERTNRERETKS